MSARHAMQSCHHLLTMETVQAIQRMRTPYAVPQMPPLQEMPTALLVEDANRMLVDWDGGWNLVAGIQGVRAELNRRGRI